MRGHVSFNVCGGGVSCVEVNYSFVLFGWQVESELGFCAEGREREIEMRGSEQVEAEGAEVGR